MAPLLVDPCDYLKPHHSVGHCLGLEVAEVRPLQGARMGRFQHDLRFCEQRAPDLAFARSTRPRHRSLTWGFTQSDRPRFTGLRSGQSVVPPGDESTGASGRRAILRRCLINACNRVNSLDSRSRRLQHPDLRLWHEDVQ